MLELPIYADKLGGCKRGQRSAFVFVGQLRIKRQQNCKMYKESKEIGSCIGVCVR